MCKLGCRSARATDALKVLVEDAANRPALVERQVLVTQLTTTREVVRVVLAEIGMKSANPNDFCLCVSEGWPRAHCCLL